MYPSVKETLVRMLHITTEIVNAGYCCSLIDAKRGIYSSENINGINIDEEEDGRYSSRTGIIWVSVPGCLCMVSRDTRAVQPEDAVGHRSASKDDILDQAVEVL